MSGTWKGAEKPAGSRFVSGIGDYSNLTDCPKCKFGTIEQTDFEKFKCIDCGWEFEIEYLKRIGVIKNHVRRDAR